MFSAVIVSVLSCVAIDVEVRSVDGVSTRGTIEKLDDQQVQLVQTDGSKRSLPIESVLSVSRLPEVTSDAAADAVQVTLVCRSQLMVRTLQSMEGAIELTTCWGEPLRVDMNLLRSIRFNSPSQRDQQWNDILASDLVGDVVVIRRSSDSLDYLEGVVRGFIGDSVSFEFDGELMDVPRLKLEGVIFFGRERPGEAGVKLVTTDGTLLQSASLRLHAEAIAVETPSELRLRVPLASLGRVDFAAGKVLYLADITPHRVDVGTAGPATVQSRALQQLLYEPRANASLFGDALALRMPGNEGIKTFSRGLAVHSRTEITYRLEGDYRRLRALAGIDPRSASRGLVKLAIFNGTNPIFSQQIGAGDDPVPIDVDVSGVRRLRLLVDYADNWDLSDHLNLCELRLTK